MGGLVSKPDVPDYRGAAIEEAKISRENLARQTWANRPTQVTPWGRTSWQADLGVDPATGEQITQWTQNVELDPTLQNALQSQLNVQQRRSDIAEGLMDEYENVMSSPLDWDQFDDYGRGPDVYDPTMTPEEQALQRQLSSEGLPELDPAQRYYQDAEQALYGQFERRMEPRFAQQEESLDVKLRNQGLRPGDEAYDYQMSQLRQSQEDARLGAQYQATTGAGAEASRMLGMDASTRGQLFGERGAQGAFANQAANQAFQQQMGLAGLADRRGTQQFGQGMQAANYANQLRQQQIAEALQRRGMSLNEVNAALTGQQVAMPSMPDFRGAGLSKTPDLLNAAGMQYQANLDRANLDNMLLNSAMDAAASMGSTAMMFSDRRLKTDITPIGRFKGLTWYLFRYVWGDWAIGGMSDEIKQLYPDAVSVHESGYEVVDYARVK